MTVTRKSHKKKITISIISIIKNKEELYAKIDYSKRDIVNTHYALIQISRQKMIKILQYKKEEFWIRLSSRKTKRRPVASY